MKTLRAFYWLCLALVLLLNLPPAGRPGNLIHEPPGAFAAGVAGAVPGTSSPTAQEPWWRHAVIYEIYPRSFGDSNGDGVGDLNGITAHLDYLRDLGVDAIWITPCFPSPQVDFGYDVSDYVAIAPEYGTMADFDHLMTEAKRRNIRVLLSDSASEVGGARNS